MTWLYGENSKKKKSTDDYYFIRQLNFKTRYHVLQRNSSWPILFPYQSRNCNAVTIYIYFIVSRLFY